MLAVVKLEQFLKFSVTTFVKNDDHFNRKERKNTLFSVKCAHETSADILIQTILLLISI